MIPSIFMKIKKIYFSRASKWDSIFYIKIEKTIFLASYYILRICWGDRNKGIIYRYTYPHLHFFKSTWRSLATTTSNIDFLQPRISDMVKILWQVKGEKKLNIHQYFVAAKNTWRTNLTHTKDSTIEEQY